MRAIKPSPAATLVLATVALCPGAGVAQDALSVSVRALAEISQPIHREAPAEVVALARTQVAARLAAPLERIRVDVGETVEAGAVLAELECVDPQDRLERARARLAELKARRQLARTRLQRTRRLREQNATSADELDQARSEYEANAANLRAQQAQVTQAERDVERCRLEAPFAGAVTARPGQPGTFVQPGSPVVELVDPDRVVLSARVQPNRLATLRQSERVVFHADGRDWRVRMRHVVAVADPATRTHEVRLAFTADRPPPATAGRIHWRAVEHAIPADLIVRRDGQLGVMRLDGERARFHALPEAVEGRPAPTDLTADTELIVQGRYRVAAGDRVAAGE